MDDRERSWPFWKFGMKEEDLSTKLHDLYNTVPSAIQDPDAFHHDVCEVSFEAKNIDDFHRLLADRKRQRIRELNNALDAASVTLSADVGLISAEQWEHAAQLFRTRSLDSLVRFFASYLAASSDATSSCSQSLASTRDSCAFSCPDDSAPSMTDEPLEFFDDFHDFPAAAGSACAPSHLPPSPCSMPACPVPSAECAGDAYARKSANRFDGAHDYFSHPIHTPPRTLSVTDSEPERFLLLEPRFALDRDDEAYPPSDSDPGTPSSTESESAYDELAKAVILPRLGQEEPKGDDRDSAAVRERLVVMDSGLMDSPTPKAERRISGLFCGDAPSHSRRQRARSPSSDRVLTRGRARADPCEEMFEPSPRSGPLATVRDRQRWRGRSVSRIQKPTPTPVRSRPTGRRRLELSQLF